MAGMDEKNKPSILICTLSGNETHAISQVLFGIEEEGIPYQIRTSDETQLEASAYSAAQESALAVGIAYSDSEVVVHYKNLQKEKPLFRTSLDSLTTQGQLRDLGSNAARLVKGLPFKITH